MEYVDLQKLHNIINSDPFGIKICSFEIKNDHILIDFKYIFFCILLVITIKTHSSCCPAHSRPVLMLQMKKCFPSTVYIIIYIYNIYNHRPYTYNVYVYDALSLQLQQWF